MTKELDKKEEDVDYIDVPAEQQKFTFTYVISEDLDGDWITYKIC